MSKVIDVRAAGGDFVILGKALVLPSSSTDGADLPLDGSIRFNPTSGAAEVYADASWAPLGAGGAHNHTMAQVTGLLAALDQKSPLVHSHGFAEVDGLDAALAGKSPLVHNHSVAQVVNLQEILDSATASIATKAPIVHTHVIANVTGLQQALDLKSFANHTHTQLDVVGLGPKLYQLSRQQFRVAFDGIPSASARTVVTTAFAAQIPQNFGGSIGAVYTAPDANVSITVHHNGLSTAVGTILIEPDGTFTFTTAQANGITLLEGDKLTFTCPAVANSTLNCVGMSIVALRQI